MVHSSQVPLLERYSGSRHCSGEAANGRRGEHESQRAKVCPQAALASVLSGCNAAPTCWHLVGSLPSQRLQRLPNSPVTLHATLQEE